MRHFLSRRQFFSVTGAALGGVITSVSQLKAKEYRIPRTLGETTKTVITKATGHRPGTVLISNADRTLDLVLADGKVARYVISIGREGFTWTGETYVARKAEWPTWRPPAEMRQRDSNLPTEVPPGPHNPLGARAIYLYDNGVDTLYRIHGTNDNSTVGGYETAGCFRLSNADVLELYENVAVGARVIVYD